MAVLQSGTTTDLATVNTDNELTIALTKTADNAGYARVLDSDGAKILTTENGALNVSVDSMLLFEQVDGSALNTNTWATSTSTMTIAQANGYITLNSGNITTGSTYAILQSIRNMPMYGPLPLRITINAKTSITPESNATMELGIGSVATNAAPTDGAFFRWNSSAEFRCVINNAGSETSSAALTAPDINDATLFDIIVVEDVVQFLIDDVLVAEIEAPTALAFPTNSGRLPVFTRVYTASGAPSVAPQLSIGQVIVAQQAMNQNKTWNQILAALGKGAYQSPLTAFGQTANHANSTSPTSATLSNTAAGYTTLGGRYQFAAVAGAATDFALFAYQVPAGYQLTVNSISISIINTGAAVATTASIFDWSAGVNSSAVSLATVDGAGTWAPRRIPLGMQGFEVGDGIGEWGETITRTFDTPLVVDSARYFHVILQCPVGTNTGSEIFRGDVIINGYFE